jgi:hypothetical protein
VYRTGESLNLFFDEAKAKKSRAQVTPKPAASPKAAHDEEDEAEPHSVLTVSSPTKPKQAPGKLSKVADIVGTRFRRGSHYQKTVAGQCAVCALTTCSICCLMLLVPVQIVFNNERRLMSARKSSPQLVMTRRTC